MTAEYLKRSCEGSIENCTDIQYDSSASPHSFADVQTSTQISVLWLCNVPLPAVAVKMGIPVQVFGGWLESLCKGITENETIRLTVCFFTSAIQNPCNGTTGAFDYYALPVTPTAERQIAALTEVIRQTRPDVIHIFGSECDHSNSMVKSCEKLGCIDKVLLSIQGLVSIYARHYASGIPFSWKYRFSLRDVRYSNSAIYAGQRDFRLRGMLEEDTIQRIKHVSGRTDWDRACVYHMNPAAKYHFCNETLREPFYGHRWSLQECKRHSIFLSQGNYPVKGLHYVVEALPLILRHYPDTVVYVGGKDVVGIHGNWRTSLLREDYGRYLLKLIRKNGVENAFVFMGTLDEAGMCQQFLSSHVFVSSATIENSPNSLGEAMILGLPSVASDVGGVKNMMTHGEEGFVYQHDAPYMLAYYVMRIFSDDELAINISEKARKHARITHDKLENARRMIQIYQEVINQAEFVPQAAAL